MSDRVVVMNGGVAEQVGAPFEVYNRPATRFVAQFVGSLNPVEATVTDPARGEVTLAGMPMALGRSLDVARGATVALALRPEAVHLGRAPGRETILRGRVTDVEFMGSVIRIGADLGGQHLSLDTFNRPDTPPPAVGQASEISLSAQDIILLA